MLLFAELFIPSGGVLGILSALCLIAAIVIAFNQSMNAGLIFLVIVLIALPLSVGLGLTFWPHTYFGRKMTLPKPEPQDVNPATAAHRELQALVGQVGRTLTQLHPSGLTEINGRRVDTMAEGMIIDPDKLVRVIAIKGNNVIVRQLEPNESTT
jgi:membrane-bound ClpP family serine protease